MISLYKSRFPYSFDDRLRVCVGSVTTHGSSCGGDDTALESLRSMGRARAHLACLASWEGSILTDQIRSSKVGVWAGKTAQWVKVPASKPNHLSFIQTHKLLQLSHPHMCPSTHVLTLTHGLQHKGTHTCTPAHRY